MSNPIQTISAADFSEALRKHPDLDILDIRTDIEFENMRLDGTVTHIPLHDVDIVNFSNKRTDVSKPLYVLCKSGGRALKISEVLAAQGQENLVVIEGGITGCKASGVNIKYADTPAPDEEVMAAIQDSVQKFSAQNA